MVRVLKDKQENMAYLNLILDSYKFLAEDFTGFSISPYWILEKFFHFGFVFLLMLIIYSLGRIILRNFFKDFYKKSYSFFLSISLGYILLASFVFVLGFFGWLSAFNVVLLLVGVLVITLGELRKYPATITLKKNLFSFNPIKFLILGFVIIAFLRLIPPQSAGDPLDYHLRFPRIYLFEQTMMIEPLGDESYTTVPHLPEMLFIISQIFTNGEASRVIQFAFFVVIVVFLYRVNIFPSAGKISNQLTCLLFVSAPFVLELSYQAFSDYPALLCILLSYFILLKEKLSKKGLVLSGILFGGALASKLWLLFYFPFGVLFVLMIMKEKSIIAKAGKSLYFIVPALLIVALWYIRGFILIGDPFYVNTDQGRVTKDYSLLGNMLFFLSPPGFISRFTLPTDYGPFYIVGLVIALAGILLKKIKLSKKYYLFVLMITAIAVFLPYQIASGRYPLPYMVFVYCLSGLGFLLVINIRLIKSILIALFMVLLSYYSFNTFVVLPYGLGWADANSYLKRELVKDHASYFDYNGEFTKNISKNEEIITYGVFELYYAHFRYKNAYYFIDQSKGTFKMPLRFNKMLIRGGSFEWFCKVNGLTNCREYRVSPITFDEHSKQYLYKIEYRNGKN